MCFILSNLKCYENVTSSSKKHLWSAKEKEYWKNNEKRNKISNLQNKFIYLFFLLWTPPTFKPHNFFIFYSFKMILSVVGTLIEILQIIPTLIAT
jgi:hypothetical protein